jgi:hypothetical protein
MDNDVTRYLRLITPYLKRGLIVDIDGKTPPGKYTLEIKMAKDLLKKIPFELDRKN